MINFFKRNKNILFFSFFSLVLAAPFIYNIFLYGGSSGTLLMDSSIFSLNLGKYFSDLFYNKSHFLFGQYSIFTINYFVFYAFWFLLKILFTQIVAYFIFCILAYWAGFYFFVKLFLELKQTDDKRPSFATADFKEFAVIIILGLLFFTSVSFFIYLKNSITYEIPYLLLPLGLYYSLKFLKTGRKIELLPLLAFSLILSSINFTYFLIDIIFINFFVLVFNLSVKKPWKEFFKRIIIVDFLFLPTFILLAISVIIGSLYFGSVFDLAGKVSEDFYSLNATYFNIFRQTADWGFFGSWQGKLYFEFAKFYAEKFAIIFALAPYILLVYLLIKNKLRDNLGIIVIFLVSWLTVFQMMLGLNNPVYKFFYDNILGFQVFRNITKFSPLLNFIWILVVYLLFLNFFKQKRNLWIVSLLLVAGLLYNLPYWLYAEWFFGDRVVGEVPAYWYETVDYLNHNTDQNSRVLFLPATYINDAYNWGGKMVQIQGSLADIFLDRKSYRLSEILIGDAFMQSDMSKLFINSPRTLRGKEVDYGLLSGFVKNYNMDYIVVTKDLVSEYEGGADLPRWLEENGYKKKGDFGEMNIYYNEDNFLPLFSAGQIYFSKLDNKKYRIFIKGLAGTEDLVFLEPYDKQWELYLEKSPDNNWCLEDKKYCLNGLLEREREEQLTEKFNNLSEPKPFAYEVLEGESYSSVAKKFEVGYNELLRINKYQRIMSGKEIIIPVSQKAQDEYFVAKKKIENEIIGLDKQRVVQCQSRHGFFPAFKDLFYSWQSPLGKNDSHTLAGSYANGWVLDPNYIKNNYPKNFYKKNSDGSIDIELIVYFRPQSYFYLALSSVVLSLFIYVLFVFNFLKR
ncbi:MAG: hypothetical protein PHD51_03060 [Patescibacteria group bacterium]|nr:hypothetical protein [Patescibacteria group bacterium]MDD5491038.1 hypothetical protein [Patescibacteria group bacterium]